MKRRYRIGNRIVQITRFYSHWWIRHRIPMPFVICPSDHPRTCHRDRSTLSWRFHSICSCLIACTWIINCLVMLARLQRQRLLRLSCAIYIHLHFNEFIPTSQGSCTNWWNISNSWYHTVNIIDIIFKHSHVLSIELFLSPRHISIIQFLVLASFSLSIKRLFVQFLFTKLVLS